MMDPKEIGIFLQALWPEEGGWSQVAARGETGSQGKISQGSDNLPDHLAGETEGYNDGLVSDGEEPHLNEDS